jgi:hypothetical protein
LQVIALSAGAASDFKTASSSCSFSGDVAGPSGGVVNNEIVLFASGTGAAIKGIGAVGTTGQFLGTPFGTTPSWTNQGSFLALTNATNQLELGSGATRTIITSPAKAAASTYTIPDAGTTASFVMNAGTNVIGGTLTLPAVVSYTGVGSITKAGAGALTLSASGAFTLTVPATGTANLIGTAQTVSAIKTHSAAIAFSGGTAADASIWFASNVLRQRGGTSGWAVDNTSGTEIISATDAGAVTLGSNPVSSSTMQHTLNVAGLPGGAAVSKDVVTVVGFNGNTDRLITRFIRNGTNSDWIDTDWEIRRRVDASDNMMIRFRNVSLTSFVDIGTGTTSLFSVNGSGVCTLGASGGTALHALNTAALTTSTAAGVNYLRITINGSVRRIPTYNDA